MEQEQQINGLLKQFKLRRTPTRSKILSLYLHKKYALAHRDIETTLSEEFDRVTIYRTLHTFEEKGLIHKVYDGSAAVKYALCGIECHKQEPHSHNHVHFTCYKCERTFCIENTNVPAIQLPGNYKTEAIHLFAKGICENCNT